eukprot:1159462-Pelagomonas_calceolata.AAC.6
MFGHDNNGWASRVNASAISVAVPAAAAAAHAASAASVEEAWRSWVGRASEKLSFRGALQGEIFHFLFVIGQGQNMTDTKYRQILGQTSMI